MPLVQRQQLEQRRERMVERRELLGEEDLPALAVGVMLEEVARYHAVDVPATRATSDDRVIRQPL